MEPGDFSLMFREISGFVPHLLSAVSLLILGWLGAWIVRAFLERGLRALRLDSRLADWGLGRLFAAPSGRPLSATRTLGTLVYFTLMLFVLIAFFDSLQLTDLTQPINRLLQQMMSYLPRIAGASIVLVGAWLVASALRLIVVKGLEAISLDSRLETATDRHPEHHPSETISSVVFWVVVLFFLPIMLRVLDLEQAVLPLASIATRALSVVPDVFAALVILLVGWIAARMVRAILIGFTEAMGINDLAGRFGITRILGGQRLSVLLGTLGYVVTLVPVVLAAIDALQIEIVSGPAIGALTNLFESLPYIFASLVILGVAFLGGRLLKNFVAGILHGFGFDDILRSIGLDRVGSTVAGRRPSDIGGAVVMVFVMIFAAMEAAEIMNFNNLANLISRFVEFMAQVVVAIVIVGIGFYLANFTRRIIRGGEDPEGASELPAAGSRETLGAHRLLGDLAYYSIVVFAFALGLQQMGIGKEIVVTAFALILGALCLALALAFGLGSRGLAERTVEEWARRLRSDK